MQYTFKYWLENYKECMDTLKEIEYKIQNIEFIQGVDYSKHKSKTNQIYNFEDKIIKKEELSRKYFILSTIIENINFDITIFSIATYSNKKILELYFLENVKKWASLSRKTNENVRECKKTINNFLEYITNEEQYKNLNYYIQFLK